MIRGKEVVGTAVRRPDGEILVHTETPPSLLVSYPWLKQPFLRGLPALIDSLRIGFRALVYSADVAMEAEKQAPPSKFHYTLTIIGALALGIGLFVLLPSAALQTVGKNHLVKNLLEGLVRIIIFVAYVLVISRMAHVRRIFEYHGAEHMVINAFEHDREITPEAAKEFGTIHVRCGSSFIMLFLVIAILVHAIFGWPVWYWRLASRILLLPVIAGIAYEMMKLAASPKAFWLTKIVTAPGLWLQKLTTRKPDNEQIEVAIAALEAVLKAEAPKTASPPQVATETA
jgi:uncharacterized protein YqhQ